MPESIERLQRELAASINRQVLLGRAIDAAADIIRAALLAGHHHGPAAGLRVLYERAADVEDVDLTGGLPHPDHVAAQLRRETAEQIAAAITERRCAFASCSACLCRSEDARVALQQGGPR